MRGEAVGRFGRRIVVVVGVARKENSRRSDAAPGSDAELMRGFLIGQPLALFSAEGERSSRQLLEMREPVALVGGTLEIELAPDWAPPSSRAFRGRPALGNGLPRAGRLPRVSETPDTIVLTF
jgi:hypothetical protein